MKLSIGNKTVLCSRSVTLLGIIIDNHLNFDEHITNLCKTAKRKVNALERIIPKLNNENSSYILVNSFFYSIFQYCPTIWMFCRKAMNTKINKLHRRVLKLLHKQHNLTLNELLQIDTSHSIHIRNLQNLIIEVYKSIHSLNPSYMKEIFSTKTVQYNLRNQDLLNIPKSLREAYGFRSIAFRSAILWNLLPPNIKQAKDLTTFKTLIKQ